MNSGFSHPRAKLSTDLVSVVSDPFHLGSLGVVSHSLLPPTLKVGGEPFPSIASAMALFSLPRKIRHGVTD
jgi:hypothetical protein